MSGRVEIGQVWQRRDGSRIRVQGFSPVDGWVKVREVGGARDRSSYPRHTFSANLELRCPKCGGPVKDAKDGPYSACVDCGHVTDSDPGFS
jgi:rRNA maturation protein Nop10